MPSEHVSMQDTLVHEHVNTQGMWARKEPFIEIFYILFWWYSFTSWQIMVLQKLKPSWFIVTVYFTIPMGL